VTPEAIAREIADLRQTEALLCQLGQDVLDDDGPHSYEGRLLIARVWWRVTERRHELEAAR
jgi:hypothetical protein